LLSGSRGEDVVNVELALLADYAVLAKDNKLTAAGIFDRLTPLTMPWQHPTMFIALRVHVHPGEELGHKFKIRLVDPDGGEIVALDGDVKVGEIDPVEGGYIQLVLALNNVPFKVFGRHAFDIFLDGRYEYTVPLVVVERKKPAGTAGEG
jgi:hypothetical protein